ncbi:MAG: potassium transporter TrkG [Lachnospiraceae bacterium]|nr:potassium transporter TrkG [Lachnospiraceae bacterium]
MLQHRQILSPFQTIIFGFAAVILAGALLLMLPAATVSGRVTSFPDALFTATSATCVTGLVVQDTASYWSGFGQAVILCLIQIGGMGVVTTAALITIISGRKIGLMQRNTMQEAISAPNVGGIVRLTSFIVKCTVLFELIGALFMLPVFGREWGLGRGLWYSVFHSVSAFCNAGFDLMGRKEPFSSLTGYVSSPVINLTVMGLIIIGGIGFLTWDDLKKKKLKIHKYRTQTKIVLGVSFMLIVLPAVYFYFCEFSSLPEESRLWASLFQSVTPRTAGFNTVDYNSVSGVGKIITMGLMLIGGSPGSTAGGMKTTTIAILLASCLATFSRREDANMFGRRISENTIKNASAIFLIYAMLTLAGGCIICSVEKLPLLQCLFETTSAIGTVGLSLGITGGLGVFSKGILIFLMFFGRVGGLTLVFAAISRSKHSRSRLPLEKITVG